MNETATYLTVTAHKLGRDEISQRTVLDSYNETSNSFSGIQEDHMILDAFMPGKVSLPSTVQ